MAAPQPVSFRRAIFEAYKIVREEGKPIPNPVISNLIDKAKTANGQELDDVLAFIERKRAQDEPALQGDGALNYQQKMQEVNKLSELIVKEKNKRDGNEGGRRKRKSTRRSRKSRTTRRRRF